MTDAKQQRRPAGAEDRSSSPQLLPRLLRLPLRLQLLLLYALLLDLDQHRQVLLQLVESVDVHGVLLVQLLLLLGGQARTTALDLRGGGRTR